MLASPADQYLPLIFAMMIAFVLGALAFILTAEYVRRRAGSDTRPPANAPREPERRE